MSLHGQKAPVVGCRPAVFGHLQGPRFHIRPCGPLRTKSPWPLSASADAENTSPESGLAPAQVAGCVSHINLGTILKMPTILVHSGCCNKNTVSWVAFNKHLFLTDLEAEVQDQGACVVRFWSRPSSWLQTASFSLCPHMAGGAGSSFFGVRGPGYVSVVSSPPTLGGAK